MPSVDPTNSTTRREKWQRKFHARWRTVRGAVRDEFEGGSSFRPRNDVPIGEQASEFREWIEQLLDDEIVQPVPKRQIRRGQHYSAAFVDELYRHGLRQANQALLDAGYEIPDQSPDAILREDRQPDGSGLHQEYLVEDYIETYYDLVDVGRELAKQAGRVYRDGARDGTTVTATIDAIDDRIDSVGQHRTDLVTQSKAIITINDAALARYEQVGAAAVGADPEIRRDTPTLTDDSEQLAGERDLSDQRQIFTTAGDQRVCDQCASIAGSVYTVAELREGGGIMPVRDTHPNCRCFFQPLDPDWN